MLPETRLRRALHLGSLSLVQRIIDANAQSGLELVCNVDASEKGETSLHLAAKLGLPDVAKFLLARGHEDAGISRTTEGITPLMIAAAAGGDDASKLTQGRIAVGKVLVENAPHLTAIRDEKGLDAFAYACRHGTATIANLLLSIPPPPALLADPEEPLTPQSAHPFLDTRDEAGNTALHHASAYGQLKMLRLLIDAGASPLARNGEQWTPLDYSATVAAEVYFRGLVREREQRQQLVLGVARGAVNITRSRGPSDTRRIARPGVRLVRSEGSASSDDDGEDGPNRQDGGDEGTATLRARAGT